MVAIDSSTGALTSTSYVTSILVILTWLLDAVNVTDAALPVHVPTLSEVE